MPPFEFLGPYRVGRTLGRGGMGTVYAAVHEKLGDKVAVKLIASHVADEPRFRRRFENEIKTLQQLRHENIVRIYGYGEESGQLFYSMELVEGETLQARIRREKKISWLPAIDIAIEVCRALKHAHDFGVLHRDLKPANLLLNQGGHVKLVDFGIAKIFGDDEQTMAGSVLGTADYMAPEQATGEGVSVRTDLYALGSVMYAMLVGRPPFRGKKVTEVIEALKRDRPVPLDLVDPHLPEALVDLVHQLLEKSPEDRPPTALAVMNRLKAMRAGLQKEQTLPGRDADTSAKPGTVRRSVSPSVTPESSAEDILPARSSTPRDGQHSGVPSREADTLISQAESRGSEYEIDLEGETELKSTTRTHFQTVTDTGTSGSIFTQQVPAPASPWWGRIGAVAMLAILIGGGAWIIKATQPPTADELYQSAIAGENKTAMNSFLTRYPNDPRAAEISDLYRDQQLSGQLKRLHAQARLGVTPLKPFEAAFVAAMSSRGQDAAATQEKLEQWLVLYGDQTGKEKPGLGLLAELARFELQRLERDGDQVRLDPRAAEMMQQIQRLADAEDVDEAQAKLRAMIESFDQIKWAQPAVAEARRQLHALEEFGQGSEE